MNKTNFIALLQQNYESMTLFFGAEMTPKINIPLAVQYTFSCETFSGMHFEAKMKNLQRKVVKQTLLEFFSTVSNRSVLSYKIVAHLLLHEDTEKELERLTKNEYVLENVGFAKSTYQSIAALFIIDEHHAKRAKVLYSEMKRQHRFLTGKDDVPYAVLLTREQADAKTQAETMRHYYEALVKNGYKRGDALQAMTQLLVLYSEHYEQELVNYIVAIQASLISAKIEIRRNYYPFIAMLALARATDSVMAEVIAMQKQLIELSMFAIEPSLALMTATQFVLQQLIENDQLQQFNNSLLFLQALSISDFLNDAGFFVAFDIFGLFI